MGHLCHSFHKQSSGMSSCLRKCRTVESYDYDEDDAADNDEKVDGDVN